MTTKERIEKAKLIYINLENKSHKEHYDLVRCLRENGFVWTFTRFGNPHFANFEKLIDVVIISGILDESVYFS